MMARSTELQSEAGYICARPLSQLHEPSCDARPDHTLGSRAVVAISASNFRLSGLSGHSGQLPRLHLSAAPSQRDCRKKTPLTASRYFSTKLRRHTRLRASAMRRPEAILSCRRQTPAPARPRPAEPQLHHLRTCEGQPCSASRALCANRASLGSRSETPQASATRPNCEF